MAMPIASGSVDHAVAVWVFQSVHAPHAAFREAARVLKPGGLFVVCPNQRPAVDDELGAIVTAMGERVDARRKARRPRGITADDVLRWSSDAGFTGKVRPIHRQWVSRPSEELAAIEHRIWPALRELDEAAIHAVTRPAVDALNALADRQYVRRATCDRSS